MNYSRILGIWMHGNFKHTYNDDQKQIFNFKDSNSHQTFTVWDTSTFTSYTPVVESQWFGIFGHSHVLKMWDDGRISPKLQTSPTFAALNPATNPDCDVPLFSWTKERVHSWQTDVSGRIDGWFEWLFLRPANIFLGMVFHCFSSHCMCLGWFEASNRAMCFGIGLVSDVGMIYEIKTC